MDANISVTLVNLLREPNRHWMSALKKTSLAWRPDTVDTIAKASEVLRAGPNAYCLVTFNAPPFKIAFALNAGLSGHEALLGWKDFAQEILKFHSNFPNRVFLVEVNQGISGARLMNEELAQRLGFETTPLELVRKTEPDRNVGDAFQFAALQLLTTGATETLCEQIEDKSIGVGDRPSLQGLWESFTQGVSRHETSTASDELNTSENDRPTHRTLA